MASGKKILRRFSSSISDLLSIQRRSSVVDDNVENTPLHTAVRMGNSVMAKNLLDSRLCDIDHEDFQGRTALHVAMEQNGTDLASLLLSRGANPDSVDYTGLTPCHMACMHGMMDIFDLLLYYKADIFAVDKSGKTPLDHACEHGRCKMVEKMLDCGVSIGSLMYSGHSHTASALHLSARMGHVQIVSILLENGWKVNKTTSFGSALHESASHGRTQVVRYLLHADIDVSLTNSSGQTALDFAKKSASRNPITWKEIRFLLKECRKFVYGEAVRDHNGQRADELSFSTGDVIWIIGRGDGNDVRYRGVIFGQKGNSRSGLFDHNTVRIVDRPISVLAMPNRLSGMPSSQTPRQVKKVDIPTLPPSANMMMIPPRTLKSEDRPHTLMNRNRPDAPSRLSDETRFGAESAMGNRPRKGHSSSQSSLGYNPMVSAEHVPMSTFKKSMGSNGESHHSPTLLTSFTNGNYAGGVCSPRNSTASNSSGFESLKGSSPASASASSSHNSFRTATTMQMMDSPGSRASIHSSNGSSGPSSHSSCSVDTLDDSGYGGGEKAVNVTQLVQKGVPEAEILALWLDRLGFSEYLSLFLTQGYDLSSIARITPEDLTAIGVTNPQNRIKLIQEIHTWQITDSWPSQQPPGGVREFLTLLALPEYVSVFESQGYTTVNTLINLNWEDLEDIGVKRLGHLKRLQLAIKKLKDCRRTTTGPPPRSSANSNPQPVQVKSQVHSARPLHEPPPPAPVSILKRRTTNDCTGNIDYISYTRGGNKALSCDDEDILDSRRGHLNLNLTATSRILSDHTALDEPCCYSGPGSDCPPPPAPLSCEASMRRLKESGSSFSSTSSSSTSTPYFANDNCGTIRARSSGSSLHSDHIAARLGLGSTFFGPDLTMDDPAGQETSADEATDVLGDLGSMLQNLMNDLDAHITNADTKGPVPISTASFK